MADFRLLARKKRAGTGLCAMHLAETLHANLPIRSVFLQKNQYHTPVLKSECEYPFTFDL